MAKYSIRDLEKLSGIKAHTLRIWEKRYNLIKPKRTKTNIRYYDDSDLKRLLNIAMLNHKGTRISRIAIMDEKEITERIRSMSSHSQDVSSVIENMVSSMISLDEESFLEIFYECQNRLGFEKAITEVIYPLFERTGALWLTGAILPAHEHFITQLIRQKICVAISNLPSPDTENSRLFILFLPEGELHETGLMFYQYLIRSAGHRVMYLGQSLPLDDLKTVQRIKNAEFAVTSFTSALSRIEIDDYIQKLSDVFCNGRVLFSEYNHYSSIGLLPPNVSKINNAAHMSDILRSI